MQAAKVLRVQLEQAGQNPKYYVQWIKDIGDSIKHRVRRITVPSKGENPPYIIQEKVRDKNGNDIERGVELEGLSEVVEELAEFEPEGVLVKDRYSMLFDDFLAFIESNAYVLSAVEEYREKIKCVDIDLITFLLSQKKKKDRDEQLLSRLEIEFKDNETKQEFPWEMLQAEWRRYLKAIGTNFDEDVESQKRFAKKAYLKINGKNPLKHPIQYFLEHDATPQEKAFVEALIEAGKKKGNQRKKILTWIAFTFPDFLHPASAQTAPTTEAAPHPG